ncbi:carbohydrate ABC transporter permease [soil metagenome]
MVGETRLVKYLKYAAVVVSLVIFLFPVYWLVNQSFKDAAEFTANPPTLVVQNPTLDNYRDIWINQDFPVYMKNSFIVASGAAIMAVTIGTMAAYSLARFRMSRNFNYHMLFAILTVRMFPPIVTIIPLFAWFTRLGLHDTRIGLVLLHGFAELPLVIWMMIGFFREVPRDMEEAALVDGDHRLAVLWKIAVPLAKPGIAATAILVFISSWNEFLYALIMTQSQDSMTLPKAVAGQITQFDIKFGNLMAAGVVTTVPVLFLALLAQRHLTRGLTVGGVTG